MQRPIRPDWLLRQARELAGDAAGRGQPRNVDLRRAASAAYYALFHTIALAAARQALPKGSETEQYGYSRYVGHSSIKQACVWITAGTPPRFVRDCVGRLGDDEALVFVAQTFLALQERRHAADYDHLATFTRAATLATVAQAETACAGFSSGRIPGITEFLGLVLLKTSAG